MWPESVPGPTTLNQVANMWVDSHMQNINLLRIQYLPPLSSSLQCTCNCGVDLWQQVIPQENGYKSPLSPAYRVIVPLSVGPREDAAQASRVDR